MSPLWRWVIGGLWGLILLRLFPRTGPGPVRFLVFLFSVWCVVEPFLAAHHVITN